MSKRKTYIINLDCEEFKKIKKNKQSIILRLNKEEFENININDKIILLGGKNKKLKKKVKQLHKYPTFEELCSNVKKKKLGYKKCKNIEYADLEKDYSKEDIKKYGVLGIEVRTKKHIIRKILLTLLVIILLFFGYRFISYKIDETNAEKMSKIISEVSKERTDYVFVEINPSFVFTVKDNKVNDVACLNDDCISIYSDIDIKDKNLNESIDIVYNVSKEKGFDTSNGVKVKISNNVNIETKDYITVEYINTTKEKEFLNEIKNNEEIKNVSNDGYYANLWEKLKKDENYDDVYTCNMNDNKELECYIILETGINKDSDYDSLGTVEKLEELFGNSQSKVYNILKKFNFDVRNNKVYINGVKFGYVPLFTLNDTPYKNALTAEKINILDNSICASGYVEYENGICQVEDGVYIIPLEKINLVNPASAINNMITNEFGVYNNIMEIYNLEHQIELNAEKEKEEIKNECISKGYHLENKTYCDNGTCVEQEMWCREESNSFISCRINCKDID